MLTGPPSSPLFPYTTLFRSNRRAGEADRARAGDAGGGVKCMCPAAEVQRRAADCRIAPAAAADAAASIEAERSEEHTSELQSRFDFVCRLLHVRDPGGHRLL